MRLSSSSRPVSSPVGQEGRTVLALMTLLVASGLARCGGEHRDVQRAEMVGDWTFDAKATVERMSEEDRAYYENTLADTFRGWTLSLHEDGRAEWVPGEFERELVSEFTGMKVFPCRWTLRGNDLVLVFGNVDTRTKEVHVEAREGQLIWSLEDLWAAVGLAGIQAEPLPTIVLTPQS